MKAWVLHDTGDAEGGDDRTHHRTDFTGIINVIQVPIWKKAGEKMIKYDRLRNCK